ncbi:hypothetical protein CFC21_043739 [Triticum aestivum]|uniref:Uncharacterized protein n=2 Tax=Triticum aestivum TaxID=4565 RepID=A0A9R1FQJ9_WHEAT|nr:hypothetical protein CFC21_043738 [Triticum aestivum]KAF7032580.1 hypothetical protein CFC21_043739 [Triticum aestivum]CAP72294.1 unnamed protein product [Triticum aestivum]CDM85939.1 unnamed protein product [Triticum aestivum]
MADVDVSGEKTTSLIIDTAIQTEFQCDAESGPPAGATTGKKKRMPAQHVSYILAMPTEKPEEFVLPNFLRGDSNMAEKMGVTEEWLEDRRRMYRESAVRTQRVHDDFVKYQAQIRDELFEKG